MKVAPLLNVHRTEDQLKAKTVRMRLLFLHADDFPGGRRICFFETNNIFLRHFFLLLKASEIFSVSFGTYERQSISKRTC